MDALSQDCAQPLVGEDWASVPVVNGRQRFARFKPVFAEKKLPEYTLQAPRKIAAGRTVLPQRAQRTQRNIEATLLCFQHPSGLAGRFRTVVCGLRFLQ